MSRPTKRSLAFGARLCEGGRSVRVQRDARGYRVEDTGPGRDAKRRSHTSLESALRDLARTWRGRLN